MHVLTHKKKQFTSPVNVNNFACFCTHVVFKVTLIPMWKKIQIKVKDNIFIYTHVSTTIKCIKM